MNGTHFHEKEISLYSPSYKFSYIKIILATPTFNVCSLARRLNSWADTQEAFSSHSHCVWMEKAKF